MHKNLSKLLNVTLLIAGITKPVSADTAALSGSQSGKPDQIQYPLPALKITVDPASVLEFCIVPLNIGDAPFATRKIMIGGGANGYKAPRTECLIAGSVVMPVAKEPDWCLLVSKYEVTVAQWNSVLGLPAPAQSEANMPVTKVSRAEVTSFIEKANEKMRQQKLSRSIESPFKAVFDHSFLRLPTEAEWEFAARGGEAVDSTVFDRPTPYEGELNRYEWFSGQNSSKGKLKAVGLLKPNPLGIYDMLGNVSEMADGHYQVEYSQGRSGGLVIRGGEYLTEEKDMMASLRTEVPWVFEDDGSAYRSSKVGFRLVLGSMVGTSPSAIDALNDAWAKYQERRIQPATVVPAIAPIARRAEDDMNNINNLTKAIASRIDQGSSHELSAKSELADMKILTTSLQSKLNEAEARSSKVAVRLASIISQEAVTNGAKRIQTESDTSLTSAIRSYKIQTCDNKLIEAGRVMEESCEMLADMGFRSVNDAFKSHLKLIADRIGDAQDPDVKAALKRQVAATEIARDIALDYSKSRRMDIDKWRSGLMKISREWVNELNK